jgi:hypothetical protein
MIATSAFSADPIHCLSCCDWFRKRRSRHRPNESRPSGRKQTSARVTGASWRRFRCRSPPLTSSSMDAPDTGLSTICRRRRAFCTTATLDLVREPVLQACAQRGLRASPDLLSASLTAPHAKVWVFDDQEAFDGALPQTLNPERWVANGGNGGRRAPLPSHLCLDVKGAFLHPRTEELFIDESKLDRAWDLFRKGFA